MVSSAHGLTPARYQIVCFDESAPAQNRRAALMSGCYVVGQTLNAEQAPAAQSCILGDPITSDNN